MAKKYLLGLPLELLAEDREESRGREELVKLLAEEEDDAEDEDIIISRLTLAARHGDEEAKEELKELLGDVE